MTTSYFINFAKLDHRIHSTDYKTMYFVVTRVFFILVLLTISFGPKIIYNPVIITILRIKWNTSYAGIGETLRQHVRMQDSSM